MDEPKSQRTSPSQWFRPAGTRFTRSLGTVAKRVRIPCGPASTNPTSKKQSRTQAYPSLTTPIPSRRRLRRYPYPSVETRRTLRKSSWWMRGTSRLYPILLDHRRAITPHSQTWLLAGRRHLVSKIRTKRVRRSPLSMRKMSDFRLLHLSYFPATPSLLTMHQRMRPIRALHPQARTETRNRLSRYSNRTILLHPRYQPVPMSTSKPKVKVRFVRILFVLYVRR